MLRRRYTADKVRKALSVSKSVNVPTATSAQKPAKFDLKKSLQQKLSWKLKTGRVTAVEAL